MIIKADSIKATTVREAIEELYQRSDVMEWIEAKALRGWDTLELLATHIIQSGDDYNGDGVH